MTTIENDATTSLTSQAAKDFLANPRKQLLIDNEWVDAQSGKTFDVTDPTTETVFAHAAEGDSADVDKAVKAARIAFEDGPWGRMAPRERGGILRTWAELISSHAEELAQLETLNNGVALQTSRIFAPYCAQTANHFAGAAVNIHGATPQTGQNSFNYTLRDPIGVCGAITPWNGPMAMATWKIAPALAAGNTLVIKPAEQTPLTTIRLVELLVEAGLPRGVINLVTGFGPGAGSSITEHPDVDKVAFTGSTEVGKRILEASAKNMKRVTLELGGKSPNIIFADSDLQMAAIVALGSMKFVSGQVCSAGTRVFVQRSAYDEFVAILTDLASNVAVGDPLDPATEMGPLASKEQYDRVSGYLDIGKAEGARAATGGAVMDRTGFFVQPTLFVDVRNDMHIAREEIFGPVLSVIPFSDEDDAVLQGNNTSYGLGAGVWTKDVSKAHRVARRIKAGTVWVNTYGIDDPTMPFGGYKQSGIGRELGLDWYYSYTEEKSVFVQL
jgi:acyl-CoA reductase-like NAD-dependent aldehyde dehydrogenase